MEAEISVAESTIFPLTKANVEFRRLKRTKCWTFNILMSSRGKKKLKSTKTADVSCSGSKGKIMKAVTNKNMLKRKPG